MESSFRPLQVILMSAGCYVFVPQSRKLKFLVFLQGTLISTSVVYCFFEITWLQKSTAAFIFFLSHILPYFMDATFSLVWCLKTAPGLRKILCDENLKINQAEFHQLKNLSRVSLAVYVAVRLIDIASSAVEIILYPKEYLSIIITLYTRLSATYFMAICVYIFVTKAQHFHEQRIIQGMIDSFRRTSYGLDYQLISPVGLSLQLKCLRRNRDIISHSFWFIPLYWFAVVFIRVVQLSFFNQYLMTDFMQSGPFLRYFMFLLPDLKLLVSLLLLVYLMFELTSNDKVTQLSLHKLSYKITTMKNNSFDYHPTLLTIKQLENHKYQCFRMFVMEKQILISFASTLITMSALLVQLLNDSLRSIHDSSKNVTTVNETTTSADIDY